MNLHAPNIWFDNLPEPRRTWVFFGVLFLLIGVGSGFASYGGWFAVLLVALWRGHYLWGAQKP